MIKNWGVDNPMKCLVLFKKALSSSFKRKPYTMPSGNIINLMGYEPYCMDYLLGIRKSPLYKGDIQTEDEITSEIEPIPYEDDMGRSRIYHPDIKYKDVIIEVKSIYTLNKEIKKNICKFKFASKIYDLQVWIIDDKGKILSIITYNKEGTGTLSSGKKYNDCAIKLKRNGTEIEATNEDEDKDIFKDILEELICGP